MSANDAISIALLLVGLTVAGLAVIVIGLLLRLP